MSSTTTWTEEDLIELLGGVLLLQKEEEEDIEGLDDDLVAYISGLLATQLVEDPTNWEEIMDESMVPFLESVGCPAHLIGEARQSIRTKAEHMAHAVAAAAADTTTTSSSLNDGTTRKLQQGFVHLSSTLTDQSTTAMTMTADDEDSYLWGTGGGGGDQKTVKANANTQMDAYNNNTSAKDRRKQKQELEKFRRELAAQQQQPEDNSTKSGVSTMLLPTIQSKEKDVQLQNISLSLENGTLLMDHGDLKFVYKRRYGLIGENGVGKTTLLSRIANWHELEGFPQHLRVLHVRQELHTEKEETSVLQAVLEADIERQTLIDEEQVLLARLEGNESSSEAGGGAASVVSEAETTVTATTMATTTTTTTTTTTATTTIEEKKKRLEATNDSSSSSSSSSSSTAFAEDLKKLKDVYERLQLLSADTAQSRAAMILSGLQFTPEMQLASIKSLSGGWRMRVALAASLLIEPDLLLLDEPTNHLDLEAVIWLERYLVGYPHTVIVVSHDRGFLNEVCTDIIEFKHKKLTYYRGNFDSYVKLRDEQLRNDLRVYQAYQGKREHMMEFINKFRANAKRASMVQSRIKEVEKMDVEAPPAVEVDSIWRFSIPSSGPLGRPIISVDDVTYDYKAILEDGSKKPINEYLLQDVNFGVDLDSRIAILGANGQGKTTLLNLIMGKITPVKGSVSINTGLRIGHFTQHHTDNFNLALSSIENMMHMFVGAEDQEMRTFLGKFQIQGNDALKPMGLLSGGQKSRVAFAALAYKKPHVLIIDEGSNHLSMEAVDALVEAIQGFKGGLMVVSHDQYFVSNTCTELWVVEGGHVTRFRGTFDEYKKHTAEKTSKRVEESVRRLGNMNN